MNPFRKTTQRPIVVSALVFATAASMASAAGGGKLIFNGKVASTDVRTVNGSAYVKLSDMAAALGMVVVKRGDGYEIVKKGGANQVEGALQGKIGDTLFDGRWRFTVTGVRKADSYTVTAALAPNDNTGDFTFDSAQHAVRPRSGNTLIIVQCRVSNGQKSEQNLWIAPDDKRRTALTTTQGESFPPVVYDVDGAPIQTRRLLPGSKIEFPVVFSIPQNAEVKDLVFTLRNNDYFQKGNDVRVSLKTP